MNPAVARLINPFFGAMEQKPLSQSTFSLFSSPYAINPAIIGLLTNAQSPFKGIPIPEPDSGYFYSETPQYKESAKYLLFLHEERLRLLVKKKYVPKQWEINWQRQMASATEDYARCLDNEIPRAMKALEREKENHLVADGQMPKIKAEFFLRNVLKERSLYKIVKQSRTYQEESPDQKKLEKLKNAVADLKNQLEKPIFSVKDIFENFITPNILDFLKEKFTFLAMPGTKFEPKIDSEKERKPKKSVFIRPMYDSEIHRSIFHEKATKKLPTEVDLLEPNVVVFSKRSSKILTPTQLKKPKNIHKRKKIAFNIPE